MPIASATPAASPSVISTGFILGGTEDTPAADEQQLISRRPEPALLSVNTLAIVAMRRTHYGIRKAARVHGTR
jgi:hypothetical protein